MILEKVKFNIEVKNYYGERDLFGILCTGLERFVSKKMCLFKVYNVNF